MPRYEYGPYAWHRLMRLLKKRIVKVREEGNATLSVGYQANYATRIHEDMTMFHKNGQAKFLEQPAREMADELGEYCKEQLKKGHTMAKALFFTGSKLLRASKKLVPVDTGFLRDSGHVTVNSGRLNGSASDEGSE